MMKRRLENRLAAMEAAQTEPPPEDVATDAETAALAHLLHVLRADVTGAALDAPISDREWAELERVGLVSGGRP